MLSDEQVEAITRSHHGTWEFICDDDGDLIVEHDCDPAWQHVDPCPHQHAAHEWDQAECRRMQCREALIAMYRATPELLAEVERLRGR